MSDEGRAGRSREWILRFGILAAATLIGFLVLEAGVRIFVRAPDAGETLDSKIFEFDPRLHHRLIPSSRVRHQSPEFDYLWTTNALGMRDHERDEAVGTGRFRILFLGDSMIQGHGVRLTETVGHFLEQSLRGARGEEIVEVLNAGVFGYSPFLEALYLQHHVDVLHPDLVLLAISLANDVGDDRFYLEKARIDPDGTVSFHDEDWPWSPILELLDPPAQTDEDRASGAADAPQPSLAGRVWMAVRPILGRSRVITGLVARWQSLSLTQDYQERRLREFRLVRDHGGDIRYDLGLVNHRAVAPTVRKRYWATTEEKIREIAGLCDRRGIGLMIVVIPPYERLVGEWRLDEPYEILDAIGAELEVPVVQLLPEFLEEEPTSLYFEFDRHWTAQGHRLAASIVDRRLRESGLLGTTAERGSGGDP